MDVAIAYFAIVSVASTPWVTWGGGEGRYLHVRAPASWRDARTACQASAPGGDLLAVGSESEHAWVTSVLLGGNAVDTWIGCWAATGEDFVGVDGRSCGPGAGNSTAGFEHWDSAEPNGPFACG